MVPHSAQGAVAEVAEPPVRVRDCIALENRNLAIVAAQHKLPRRPVRTMAKDHQPPSLYATHEDDARTRRGFMTYRDSYLPGWTGPCGGPP